MRARKAALLAGLILCFQLSAVQKSEARSAFNSISKPSKGTVSHTLGAQPNTQFEVHNINRLGFTITNYGNFGTGYVTNPVIFGQRAPSCEYPINSGLEYLFAGGIWIGAIVGRDTLVSVGLDGWFGINELFPDVGGAGTMQVRSNSPTSLYYDEDAVSQQDIVCSFTDTFTAEGLTGIDSFDNRPHIPINVSVLQSSYAWSYEYAEDFILIDYKITNIGEFPIREMFMSIYIDADVGHVQLGDDKSLGDISGFRRTFPAPPGSCYDTDTANIAWIADADGDPAGDAWSFTSVRSVTGTEVIRSPNPDLRFSFNWWISNASPTVDFGPRLAGTPDDPFRSFGTHKGTPTGDRNKYYIMSHEEFDYDQMFTAVSHTNEGWEQPPSNAEIIARGFDTRYLLSFGPFDLPPDSSLPITIAYVAGEDFHRNATDHRDLFDTYNPDLFYQTLDFSDLARNTRWANWIFDNPGVDTDGDRDSGRFCWVYIWDDTTAADPGDSVIVDSTKQYYAGDGVPDFRGAAPPDPPRITITPRYGGVTLRWNGQITEHSIDPFSQEMDFEGYRVYMAQNDRSSDFVLLTSYDREDYQVFEFDPVQALWISHLVPVSRDSLMTLFGPSFDPLDFPDPGHYFENPRSGKLMYFAPQDWNQSSLTDPHGIHRVFPLASPDDPVDTTEEGFLRYYEYEYDIEDLLPSIPHYFAVTAFDYGSGTVGLGALESSPLTNAVQAYPLPSSDEVTEKGLHVTVYPNPYRGDAGYARVGYENRDRDRSNERARHVIFSNLPEICTIRIFTLDGDLVKEIHHDNVNNPGLHPYPQAEEWNLITRNTQAVVTGIYLWQVESAMGEQIGKLVILK